MRKLLLAICLFASAGAMAQDTPKTDLTAKWKGTAGDKQPGLIIIDGKKYEGQLNDINADSIKSISVLKDKASTAIYGEAAKDGVILITTKKTDTSIPVVHLDADASATKSLEPMYVIDGIKADKSKVSAVPSGDIDRIEVLKNANATAIYGPDALNGVVLVTTKASTKGAKSLFKTDQLTPATADSAIYIVDGVKTDAAKAKAIDPKNIDTVEIVKDASASAPYGSGSSNSVIKITTKAGAKKAKEKTKN